ncbi:MAG: DUF2865 domain-containing protein [Ancalomicrobiaceae bacterium]|nr:DUF2865 domain-containing protein [Ancalomicrobiaceae bacterium]
MAERTALRMTVYLLLALGLGPDPGEALAQSNECLSLANERAAIDRRSVDSDPYLQAIIRQRAAIARAETDYQRYCTAGLFRQPSSHCPELVDKLREMQANMAKLERYQRAPSREEDRRRSIEARMARLNCADPPVNADRPVNQGNPITAIFGRPQPGAIVAAPSRAPTSSVRFGQATSPGVRTFTLDGPNGPVLYREEPGGRLVMLGPATATDAPVTGTPTSDDPMASDDPNAPPPEDGGTYSTLCVRTCDGYYFPISYSATRGRFAQDTDICRARCPGTETRLFVHPSSTDSETAVAADDTAEPYSELPNALRYRSEVVPNCACGRADPTLLPPSAASVEDRSRNGLVKVSDPRAELPIPLAKPAIDEDPETLADLAIGLVPHVVDPAKVSAKPTGPRTVRIVGPKFYADR